MPMPVSQPPTPPALRSTAQGIAAILLLASTAAHAAEFAEPPHDYWNRKPADRFARLNQDIESGKLAVDASSEKSLLASLLKALDIDDSTQLMVFSATSLQSGIVNPRNPRALYFNEDTFVGFIPGGRLEIASFDPDAGMVFYISDRSRVADRPAFTRSTRCMNCHADTQSRHLPGLVISSVGVTWDGSTQETYRYDEIGHHVPLAERFGGWHLTTTGSSLATSHANKVGHLIPGGFKSDPNPPGKYFPLANYPRPTSDLLPNLVMEHAAGFTNRVTEAIYQLREKPDDPTLVDKFSRELTRYLLFAGEASLPAGGIKGDPDFIRDFLKRSEGKPSAPFRQFDLKSRIFRHRISFMLDSSVYRALPTPVRRGIESLLADVAAGKSPWKDLSVDPDGRKALLSYLLPVPAGP